jgi:hypothetical protein
MDSSGQRQNILGCSALSESFESVLLNAAHITTLYRPLVHRAFAPTLEARVFVKKF